MQPERTFNGKLCKQEFGAQFIKPPQFRKMINCVVSGTLLLLDMQSCTRSRHSESENLHLPKTKLY